MSARDSNIEEIATIAHVAYELCKYASFKDAVEVGLSLAKEAALEGLYAKAAFNAPLAPNQVVMRGNPRAQGSVADYIGRVAQLWSGKLGPIPNKPGPLSSMLVMAPLGAALGVGAGYIGNKLTGGHAFNSPVNNALLGASAGMLPGLGYAALNYMGGQPALTGTILDGSDDFEKTSGIVDNVFGNYIPVDNLKQMIYRDPFIANALSAPMQAATVGLVEGAQNLPGRRTDLPIVTPHDIARMAVGLGSGYASGLVVGKVLGGLLGMSDKAKQTLATSGATAGLLKAVIPMAYGSF